jgi:hypothetical protein
MTWIMLNLVSVHLATLLGSMQDRCMDCAKRTIGSENCFGRTRWYSLVMILKWKLILVYLEIVLILMQYKSTVCVERTIVSEIIFDAPDGTPR